MPIQKGLVVKNTAAQSVRSEENYGILLTSVSEYFCSSSGVTFIERYSLILFFNVLFDKV